ncbi:uncharacterized protein BDZ83DRAFT_644964 [Colletotrichum acutatum]|uniref:Uncharacterized protein n=1 Tax=Glomerella acutata TaxID=27357 RepID=A0AAD8X7H3_GLOAC|nr:uncharacterized protein BDZ83DRAFT_644964 [Colletotrichum acutatum]KAK1703248.1 hypothetical protein BDZ83DRAFT_644964 [Colletotrichum acutatum]
MLMNLNGREHTRTAFENLCSAVTPKLEVKTIFRPELGGLSLIGISLALVSEARGTLLRITMPINIP